MKRLLGLLFLLAVVVTYPANAQDSYNINKINASITAIKHRAFNAPDRISTNKYQLTQYLIKPFKNDYDKLRVIAYWIASHIAYDNYKYDNGKINVKEMKVKYDILQAKAGICTDFAELFAQMADIANIKKVEIVKGYVLKNVRILKKYYRQNEMPHTAHAWNKITLNGRQFFVDTTYMSANRIGAGRKYKSSLKHKLELQKRARTDEKFSQKIDEFYFDFSPREEIKRNQQLHLLNKYVH
ncbi:MAG: transglutaminase domain-containing protein [Alphaproteobacteria bacterium]|nr:transglutaminase domain-containing protein [Alphaproteobacteria bacterium]